DAVTPYADLDTGYGLHCKFVRTLLKGRKVHGAKFGRCALFAKFLAGSDHQVFQCWVHSNRRGCGARRNLETCDLALLHDRAYDTPTTVTLEGANLDLNACFG